MASLVGILTAQHRAIEKRAASISEALAQQDRVRLYVELPALRSAISSHLRFEEAELYAKVRELAEAAADSKLLWTGRKFAAGIAALAKEFDVFFEQNSDRQVDLAGCASQWAPLLELLTARIRSEEERLYAAFTEASDRRQRDLLRTASR